MFALQSLLVQHHSSFSPLLTYEAEESFVMQEGYFPRKKVDLRDLPFFDYSIKCLDE